MAAVLAAISFRQAFKFNTRKFPECTKFTTHYLPDTSILSSCTVVFIVWGKLPSVEIKCRTEQNLSSREKEGGQRSRVFVRDGGGESE